MQEIARKNRQTFYTTHPTPSNFYNSVSVFVFQFVMVYLKSDTAYPVNFTKTICIFFFSNEDLLNSSYFCGNILNINIQWRNTLKKPFL